MCVHRHYGREIAAFDIHTQRVDVYGEDAGYEERVLLLYDGLHYDALALAQFPGAPEDMDVSVMVVRWSCVCTPMTGGRVLCVYTNDGWSGTVCDSSQQPTVVRQLIGKLESCFLCESSFLFKE